MADQRSIDIDKLSEIVRCMQKCLQCAICLETISVPVKTRCGHSFCRICIGTVLSKRNAMCPLCNTGLKRRGISEDEHMEMCIDRLETLINAVCTDTGINILSHVRKPRDTKESCSDTSHFSEEISEKHRDKEQTREDDGLQARQSVARNQLDVGQNAITRKDKNGKSRLSIGKQNDVGCSISGVYPLDETNDSRPGGSKDTRTVKNKVQWWLRTLPDGQTAENSGAGTSAEQMDCSLDDTIIECASEINETELDHNHSVLKLGYSETKDTETRRARNGARGYSFNCPRESVNEVQSETRKLRKSLDSCNDRANDAQLDETRRKAQTKPPEGQKRSRGRPRKRKPDDLQESGVSRVASEQQANEVNRTASDVLLPSAKKTWSHVVQVGKGMRTRRGRPKSLNVSVEKNNTIKKSDETVEQDDVKSWRLRDKRESDAMAQSEQKTEDKTTRESTALRSWEKDQQQLNNAKPPCVNDSLARDKDDVRSAQPANYRNDSSFSEHNQTARESSFITLEKGEQVKIRNLNNDQMNDIIGVADAKEDSRDNENNVTPTKLPCGKNSLSLKRHSDRSNDSPQKTPSKTILNHPLLTSDDNFSPPENRRIRKVSELFSSPKFQTPTLTETSSRSLSLKKHQNSGGRKSNESVTPDNASRLSTVKRDLSEKMLQNSREPVVAGSKASTSLELRKVVRDHSKSEEAAVRSPGDLPGQTSMRFSEESGMSEKRGEECLVKFKKLGKTFKRRRRFVKFLYLGFTRREQLIKTTESCLGNMYKGPSEMDQRVLESSSRAALETEEEIWKEEGIAGKSKLDKFNETNECADMSLTPPVQSTSAADKDVSRRTDLHVERSPEKSRRAVYNLSNKSPESIDVVFVSLSDEERRDKKLARKVDNTDNSNKVTVRENILIKGTVKLLSPEKDSQLKFLSTKSPSYERPKVARPTHQSSAVRENWTDNKESGRRSTLSELKGVHSRALILRSQEANENLDGSLNPGKKRKRLSSCNPRESLDAVKKPSLDDSDCDQSISSVQTVKVRKEQTTERSNRIESSNVECSKKCGLSDKLDIQGAREDTDAVPKETLDNSKKGYKRIVCASSSDTDSSDIAEAGKKNAVSSKKQGDARTRNCTVENASKSAEPQISKRKRTLSGDLDDDVKKIVNEWCNTSNLAQLPKKGKAENAVISDRANTSKPANKPICLRNEIRPRLANIKDMSTMETDIFDTYGQEKCSSRQNVNERKKEAKDQFNDIIDRVRNIQRTENACVRDNPIDTTNPQHKQRVEAAELCMQDNFDEAIANVSTQDFLDTFPCMDFVSGTMNADEQRQRQQLSPRDEKRVHPTMHADLSNGSGRSDKENDENIRSKGPQNRVNQETEDEDRTLTPGNSAGKKVSEKINHDKLHGKALSTKDEKKTVSRRSNQTKDVSMVLSTNGLQDKDSFNEQDSLMDVTQQQLLLKQFEDDLLGGRIRGQTKMSEAKAHSENKRHPKDRTPEKGNGCDANLCMEDAEHSCGEDEIIEGTPNAEVRSVASLFSSIPMLRNSSQSMGRLNERISAGTPSPLSEKSANSGTPLSKKGLRPLYQSTPKSTRSCASARSLNAAACANDSRVRRTSNASMLLMKENVDSRQVPRKLCLVYSGLVPSQIECVEKFANTFSGTCLRQFDQKVTHVIVKTKENNAAVRTLKYLQGIANRKWVVSFKWITDCIREQKLLEEDPYEAVDEITLEAGPRNSRLRQKDLFEGFVFLCIGPYSNINVEHYQEMLLSTGGMIVGTFDAIATIRDKLKIIVVQVDTYNESIIEWYRKTRAVPIVSDWIVECISQYKLVSLSPYLQELVPQDVLAVGFPEELVEDDESSDCTYESTTLK